MTQTLRRERRLKFIEILSAFSDKLSRAEIEATAELLADAATSDSERRTDETFGEYHIGPNTFRIFEENIGTITPMIADQLNEIDKTYPAGWFKDATLEALKNNKRSLSYVTAILKRWKSDGKDAGKKPQAEKSSAYETL